MRAPRLKLATPTPFKCERCAHSWSRGYVVACNVTTDELNGEPVPCDDARKPHNPCGPRALLFRARAHG